jgi:hypothetical protein
MLAVEYFLLQVVGGVIIMVAGFKAYPRVTQHDCVEPSSKLYFLVKYRIYFPII